MGCPFVHVPSCTKRLVSVFPDNSPAPKAFGAGLLSEEQEDAKHVPQGERRTAHHITWTFGAPLLGRPYTFLVTARRDHKLLRDPRLCRCSAQRAAQYMVPAPMSRQWQIQECLSALDRPR